MSDLDTSQALNSLNQARMDGEILIGDRRQVLGPGATTERKNFIARQETKTKYFFLLLCLTLNSC